MPIIAPLAVIAIAMFLLAAPILWPISKLRDLIGERRKAKGWHRWFAWRPVKLPGFYFDRDDSFVWLETIDRKWLGGWSYRFPDELDFWERREVLKSAQVQP
jgi:hypothetical protein